MPGLTISCHFKLDLFALAHENLYKHTLLNLAKTLRGMNLYFIKKEFTYSTLVARTQ